MKAFLKKIKDRSGISLVIALILMLVIVMVVSVIISAANTASKNINYDKNQQQAYLTVSTAAAYMRAELENGTMKLKDNTTIIEANTHDSQIAFEGSETSNILYSGNCDFAPLLRAAVNKATTSFDDSTTKFTMKFTGSGEEDYEFQLVYVTFVIKSNYDIKATLELKEYEHVTYRMTINLPVDRYRTDYNFADENNPQYDDDGNLLDDWHEVTVLTWAGGTIMRGRK